MISKAAIDWVKAIKQDINTLVNYTTHEPTDNELNNLCYLSMKLLINWPMRKADFAVVQVMGGDVPTVADLDKKFIPELANYMWDHLLGSPPTPTVEDLVYCIQAVRDALYSMSEDVRNDIEGKPSAGN